MKVNLIQDNALFARKNTVSGQYVSQDIVENLRNSLKMNKKITSKAKK